MQPKSRTKLRLNRETLRALTLTREEMGRVVGGISGPRGCHSIDDQCPDPSGGALCTASANQQCPSGNGGGCGESMHSICP